MNGKSEWIESLDIPEHDRQLLYLFEDMPWEDIRWWECESKRGKEAAKDIMRTGRCRDEVSCGID